MPGYVGPYEGRLNARNFWTSAQDMAVDLVPDVPPVTIDPESGTFTEEGGTGSFAVEMTGPGLSQSWTVDKDSGADWLTLLAPLLHEPQYEDGSVSYSVSANGSGTGRTANFYVNGKTYAVTQA